MLALLTTLFFSLLLKVEGLKTLIEQAGERAGSVPVLSPHVPRNFTAKQHNPLLIPAQRIIIAHITFLFFLVFGEVSPTIGTLFLTSSFNRSRPYLSAKMSKPTDDEFDPVRATIEKLKPGMKQMTFGSIVGYCSGSAAKKIGKALSIVLGMGFILVQSAVYTGYIEVDWDKVQKDAVEKIDATGDGKLDTNDLQAYWKKVKKILTHKVPSAGGFSLGFLYGLQS